MVKHTLDEKRAYLQEQLQFIEASAERFDSGHRSESRRIAQAIRVLMHDANDPSLLEQLGLKSTTRFLDTATPRAFGVGPKNGGMPYTGLCVMGDASAGMAPLDGHFGSGSGLPFEEWWKQVVFESREYELTRKQLVLAAANKTGGSHVAPEVQNSYASIRDGRDLGFRLTSDDAGEPMKETELISLRQIGHEVLKSLIPGYRKGGPSGNRMVFGAVSISGTRMDGTKVAISKIDLELSRFPREGACPCGSGRRFVDCHGEDGRSD